jgi:acyl-CoA thioesterase-1
MKARTVKFFRLLAAWMLLAACTYPTQAVPIRSQDASAQTATTAEKSWPVIVAFGDSLTSIGEEDGASYPDFLQKDLLRDGFRYRVVNLGVGGNTTKDGLARVKDVLAQRPALVIVGLGGNDGLRGEPVAQMRANLDQILATLVRAHIPLVLGGITLPPNYGVNYVREFNAVYPALAAKYHVPLLPFMLQGVFGMPGMMRADGIHPTDEGNQIVAKNYLPLVEAQLKKLRPQARR